MNNIDFAIERVFRFFENQTKTFECYVVQMTIKKTLISNGNYNFTVKDINNVVIYEVTLYVDTLNGKVIEKKSHEDPLITTENDYLVCLQLSTEILSSISGEVNISFGKSDMKPFIIHNVKDINQIFRIQKINNTYSSIINDYNLVSKKDCILRIHVGNRHGKYHEEEYKLEANKLFYFKEYLNNNAYIGLQCSYENENTEIEEKYIVIGQKGMVASHDIWDGQYIYQPLLPFIEKYKTLMMQNNLNIDKSLYSYTHYIHDILKEVENIDELLNYLENKELLFFETSINFIKPQYVNKNTYGLNNTYNKQINKISHINSDLCMQCKNNTKCLQIVPSGLSRKLLKENSAIDNETECRIYNFIDNKVNK